MNPTDKIELMKREAERQANAARTAILQLKKKAEEFAAYAARMEKFLAERKCEGKDLMDVLCTVTEEGAVMKGYAENCSVWNDRLLALRSLYLFDA